MIKKQGELSLMEQQRCNVCVVAKSQEGCQKQREGSGEQELTGLKEGRDRRSGPLTLRGKVL